MRQTKIHLISTLHLVLGLVTSLSGTWVGHFTVYHHVLLHNIVHSCSDMGGVAAVPVYRHKYYKSFQIIRVLINCRHVRHVDCRVLSLDQLKKFLQERLKVCFSSRILTWRFRNMLLYSTVFKPLRTSHVDSRKIDYRV